MYKFCPHCGKAFIDMAEPRSVPVISQKKGFFTWEKAKELSNNNAASKFFEVGDEVYETLKSGEEIVLVVVGKDMYREGDVIFGLKDCLKDEYAMNETSTNAGGWMASSMRIRIKSGPTRLSCCWITRERSCTSLSGVKRQTCSWRRSGKG